MKKVVFSKEGGDNQKLSHPVLFTKKIMVE